jgi:uncharacterized protein YndB with AHSA1/START domain
MRDTVTVNIAAPADRVWDLISDVTGIGRFSPETFDAEWLDGAAAPAVGVRFRGHVRRNGRGPVYWTTCTIVACEPARELAFTVDVAGRPINTWRYSLEATPGGTDVTESFELTSSPATRVYWRVAGRARNRTNLRNMRTTLERVKAVAEARDDAG